MATLWQVIVPEATTNLISNPSFEVNTTGYTAVAGGVLTQSTTEQAVGLYSGKYVPTANTGDGIYFALTLAANTNYTFSVSVFGVNGVDYKIYLYDATAPAILGTPVTFVGNGTWKRHVVTASTGANTSSRVYVIKDGSASVVAFYIDAVQVEAKAYPTTFCDGDQDGCVWIAGTGTSTSSRSAQSTSGGRVKDLAEEEYMRVRKTLGMGVPTAEIISTEPGQGDGGDYQTTFFKPRQCQLIGTIQGKGNQVAARVDFHRKRKNLIQAFNPHGVDPKQPRGVRYRLDGKSVEIRADYETGLQRQKALDSVTVEEIALGLKAQDPFWRAAMGVVNEDNGAVGIEGQGALSLTVQTTVTNANYILEKDSTGAWVAMGTGLSVSAPGAITGTPINAIVEGPDGAIYIGGAFTLAGGVANTSRIAKWDGTAYSALGTGANGTVLDLVFGTDGTLYAVGAFAAMGGVANTQYIAQWDGSNWTAMGTGGHGGTGAAEIQIDPSNGDVVVTGTFTDMGGVANTGAVAKWTGAAWGAFGGGITAGAIVIGAMAYDSNDDLWVNGTFTAMDGVPNTDQWAKWTGAAWSSAFAATPGVCAFMRFDSSDALYVGGSFLSFGGAADTRRIAKYDGAWSSVGGGETGGADVSKLLIDSEDNVYAGGVFTQMGGITNTIRVAKYIAATDTWEAMETGANATVQAFALNNIGQLLAGGGFTIIGSDGGPFAKWNGVRWEVVVKETQDIIQATDGKIYVGGGYVNAGGVANADRISYWEPSGEAWTALSTGANGVVHAIAEAPNGDIYIGGSFTLAGGVGNTTGIAYWDISGSVWLPLSTGTSGTVFSLAFSPDGDLYIGGLFEDLGGVADTQNLAKWNGAAFVALSDEPNGAVNTLVFDRAGTLWLGGAFTLIGAVTYDYIANYDPATDTFNVLQVGTNGFVNDMDFGPDGNLYFVGTFTQAGGVSANYIAYWNGTQFFPMGTGFNNVGYAIDIDSDGQVFAGGAFTTASGVTLPDKFAKWNGSVWTSPDVDLPGNAAVEAILVTTTGIFVGFDTSGSAIAAGIDIASYQGDSYGYPVFTAIGPGQLYELSNLTGDKHIYFDLLLETGETVELDLRPGIITFTSTFRGDIGNTILEGSDDGSFILLPGDNSISVLIGDATAEAFILWDERFQSFDSVVYLPIVNN